MQAVGHMRAVLHVQTHVHAAYLRRTHMQAVGHMQAVRVHAGCAGGYRHMWHMQAVSSK